MKKLLFLFLLIAVSFISFSQEIQRFGKVDIEDIKMSVYEKDTSASAVVLFDYGNSYFRRDNQKKKFVQIIERHVRIKILTKDGLDYANVEIHYNDEYEAISALRARVYNLNEKGKIDKEKVTSKNIF